MGKRRRPVGGSTAAEARSGRILLRIPTSWQKKRVILCGIPCFSIDTDRNISIQVSLFRDSRWVAKKGEETCGNCLWQDEKWVHFLPFCTLTLFPGIKKKEVSKKVLTAKRRGHPSACLWWIEYDEECRSIRPMTSWRPRWQGEEKWQKRERSRLPRETDPTHLFSEVLWILPPEQANT